MGIDFGVIWAADFNNVKRFYVRRPDRRQRVSRRPPSHQNVKKTTDISLWVWFLGLFGSLISMMSLDFTSNATPAGQGWPAGQWSPAARRHTKIKRRWQIYRYGYRLCNSRRWIALPCQVGRRAWKLKALFKIAAQITQTWIYICNFL